MICQECDKPIKKGQKVHKEWTEGCGVLIYHKVCKKLNEQRHQNIINRIRCYY